MNEATIATWNLLPSLGFRPDSRVRFSDIRPGLSLDFGNFNLSAAALVSPYSGEIVSFSGILATQGILADVHFEMPRKVESLGQCAAWIVWEFGSVLGWCLQTGAACGVGGGSTVESEASALVQVPGRIRGAAMLPRGAEVVAIGPKYPSKACNLSAR